MPAPTATPGASRGKAPYSINPSATAKPRTPGASAASSVTGADTSVPESDTSAADTAAPFIADSSVAAAAGLTPAPPARLADEAPPSAAPPAPIGSGAI